MNVTRDKLYQIFEEDNAKNDSLLFWDEERWDNLRLIVVNNLEVYKMLRLKCGNI